MRTTLELRDLVRFYPKRGNRTLVDRGLLVSYTGEDRTCTLLRLDGTLVTKKVDDIAVVDRSSIHVGQMVGSASDVGGQIGVVTGFTTDLHLVQLNERGGATKNQILGVSPAGLRRVRALSLGDYVLSGSWLGRVVAVPLDVDVLFHDGAVCRVTHLESQRLKSATNKHAYHIPETNVAFYPGERVTAKDGSATVFKGSRWLSGRWKPEHEIGTVANVEMAGVFVYWIASAQHGTKQQLVQESAPPPYQQPDSLAYLCSAPDCSWRLGDRCFLLSDEQQHISSLQAHSALLPTMTVANSNTTVDVLWQDGTRQYGARSTSLSPYDFIMEHDFFPGQCVVYGVAGDGVGAANGSTRRVGVVRSLNSKDQTVHVSWFKAASTRPDGEASGLEVECDDTVSAYDLGRDPDHSVLHGDVVVRVLSSVIESTPAAQQIPHAKSASADLPWVGRVVDLNDGHVQVKWSDGSTSLVFPHEISVANKEHYTQLYAEMYGWEWDEEEDDDDDVGAPPEFDAANVVNGPHDPADARNIEGGDCSVNELDGPAATTQNVEAPTLVSTVSHEDPNVGGAVVEVGLADPVERSDASVNDSNDDSVDDVVIKAKDAIGDDGPFKFPNFDVLKSPPDHHYLDTADQGSSGGKEWVKTVQKEWKILQDNLPETIYVRAFEDHIDLLQVAMVGASGTPYQDGLFFFDLQLPLSYPNVPPQVYYHSFGNRLNPNLYASGTVCLSLLNTFDGEGTEVWVPGTSSLLQVVVSLQALVLNDQPYYNEANYEHLVGTPQGHRHALPYNENAFLLTLRTMLHLLRRPPRGFEGFIRDHFRRRGRYILATCEAYLQGCVPADHGRMELSCSTGLRIALDNVLPRLRAAFTQLGDEGSYQCTASSHQHPTNILV
ncbi:probable ubiquitin-conjugating enzyme E2 23 [Triticum dicoccoides]|uniref:probable ubiquitin-conjugating enzyme E2 23 n=1 Tax=Triticum dicoccoides TaxID=85692 RepID=UPI00188DEE9A|nr:probable ubiquitin-conjugating enzyme E2 23 [Triticum dicoccoides]